MNKKAEQFTLSEFMKIVLGVLSIGLLLYLAASMYGMFSKEPEIKQAGFTLEQIKEAINKLEEGGSYKFLLESPANWLLTLRENKLCICPGKFEGGKTFPDCSAGVCDEDLGKQVYNSNEIYLGIAIDIKDVYISKNKGVIVIEKNQGSYTQTKDLFDEVLSFKEQGLSVEELLVKYINGRDENVKTELNSLLKNFFDEKKIYGIFYVTDVLSGKTADVYGYSILPTSQDLSKGTPQTKNIQGEDKKTYQLFFNAIPK